MYHNGVLSMFFEEPENDVAKKWRRIQQPLLLLVLVATSTSSSTGTKRDI